MPPSILVGDIGGTHFRLAIAEFDQTWHLTNKQDIEIGAGAFQPLLQNYLIECGSKRPVGISLAVAGPVNDGAVTFTNRNWHISEKELACLGFSNVLLVNDFKALAFAASHMRPEQLFTLGPEHPGKPGAPIAVLGAGTGFGASYLVRHGDVLLPYACEAGHIGFAPGNDTEDAVLKILRKRFGRVSVERLLSGPGLENILGGLSEFYGLSQQDIDAAAIMHQGGLGQEPYKEAVAIFCAIYGAVAGDLALAFGAQGGIFVAGGIAPKIKTILAGSQFRQRFQDKGRLSYYVQPIATKIIIDLDATLIGAALALALRVS